MELIRDPSPFPWHFAIGAGALAGLLVISPVPAQQPCNPVIDGTYCATQMPRTASPSRSSISMAPIQDIGSAISLSPTSAGTLGGISFRSGGSACIGLMRRGNCS